MRKPTPPSQSAFAADKAKLLQIATEAEDFKRATGGSLADVAAGWVTPQYLLVIHAQLACMSEDTKRFKLLRLAAGDVVAFQRGDHSGARVQLEREKLALANQKYRDAAEAKKVQKLRDVKSPMTDEDRKAIVDKADEILGLK